LTSAPLYDRLEAYATLTSAPLYDRLEAYSTLLNHIDLELPCITDARTYPFPPLTLALPLFFSALAKCELFFYEISRRASQTDADRPSAHVVSD
jgi:hypothetical protein